QAGGVPAWEVVVPSVCAMAVRAADSSMSPASSGMTVTLRSCGVATVGSSTAGEAPTDSARFGTRASGIVAPLEREGAVPDDPRPVPGGVPGAARAQQHGAQAVPARGDEQAV